MEQTTGTKHYEFKAEVKQLLNILVHSLYTHRDIFLRELISNASDALEKIRFESTKGTDIEQKELPLEIILEFDEKKHTITISDTGIGMTEDELINNIGTIAKSGTSDFLRQLETSKENVSSLIGKFGVGFYSVFMVAEKVEIKTKSFLKGNPALKWISDGLGSYEIITIDEKLKRGTEIKIILNNDSNEFANKYRLEEIIKKHSNFISFPIKIGKDQINTVSAIWREPKSSIKKEQYLEFYKFLTYDSEEPLQIIHKSVDAPIQFNCLLFIPRKNYDLYGYMREDYGLDLYVRRVLIQHKNRDLLPEYLGFVRGVVDSEDLPLNISRETLQENIIFNKIANSVTTQILTTLQQLANDDKEKYIDFWKEHNRIFKMGYTDFANRDKFFDLLRYNSSHLSAEKEFTSLTEYTGRMKKDQKEIYYLFGPSREAIINDPHVEIFKKKGIEVIYLYDPIDEFVINSLGKYKDFEMKSVDQVDLKKLEKFDDLEPDKHKTEKLDKENELHFKSLLSKMKDILGDKVTEVNESKRLQDSPACLVNPDNTMSSTMQKMMSLVNKETTIPKKIMEINKDHRLIRNLIKVFRKDSNDPFIKEVTEQLFESSLLLEGFLTDPHKLVNRVNSLMTDSSEWYNKVKNI